MCRLNFHKLECTGIKKFKHINKHILNIIILTKNKYFKYLVLSCFIVEGQVSLFSGGFLFFSPSLSRG